MSSSVRTRTDPRLSTEKAVRIYKKVLQDLVDVNSLFTTAVFIGISFARLGQHSFLLKKDCDADESVAKRLLVFEVIAFGCYLLSSLVAKALKVHLSTYLIQASKKFRLWRPLVMFLLLLSTWGSILGCLFLTLSMVNIIQILLGKTSCEGSYTFQAARNLISIVTLALVIYITFMMRTMFSFFCKC